LGGRKYLEANYNFSTDINKVDREVYNIANGQETINTQLTNKYNSNYLYNRPGFNFRMNRDKYNFSAGAGWQQTRLNGNLILKNEKINRLFQAVLPAAHFNYDFTNFKRLRFDYTTNMQEPTIQQLQPIVDNSDPLNLSVGNPQLRPAYAHQLRSNFTFFDPSRFMNVFALLNANYTRNSITNSQSVDQNLVRTTKPVNVRNSMNVSGNFNVGIPVKVINSRFNIGPNYSATKGINLINNQENTTKQQTVGSTARYNYSLGEILIVDLSANMSRQETKYSFNTQQNQIYLNQTYTAEVNVNFLKNYSYNSEMDYFVYNSKTTNFHQSIPLWNMSVSRYILKNKAGELKLGVNNLLNRSLSVTQSSGTNYLQQQTTNNLGRFYMISFTYALNKQLNPMGEGGRRGRGGPRMMMIRQ
jgi:outer membrane receptor protein involved in Fe transport